MDATLLKSILRRFKIADYPYIIENWKSLSKEFSDVNLKHVKKADFVDMVMKKFKVCISILFVTIWRDIERY